MILVAVSIVIAITTAAAAMIQKIPILRRTKGKEKKSLILRRSVLMNSKGNEIVVCISTNIKRGMANMIQIRIDMIERKKLKVKIRIDIICSIMK